MQKLKPTLATTRQMQEVVLMEVEKEKIGKKESGMVDYFLFIPFLIILHFSHIFKPYYQMNLKPTGRIVDLIIFFSIYISSQIHFGFLKICNNLVCLFTGSVTLLCPFCEELQSSPEDLERHSLARHGELNLDSEDGFENATQGSEVDAEASGKSSQL